MWRASPSTSSDDWRGKAGSECPRPSIVRCSVAGERAVPPPSTYPRTLDDDASSVEAAAAADVTAALANADTDAFAACLQRAYLCDQSDLALPSSHRCGEALERCHGPHLEHPTGHLHRRCSHLYSCGAHVGLLPCSRVHHLHILFLPSSPSSLLPSSPPPPSLPWLPPPQPASLLPRPRGVAAAARVRSRSSVGLTIAPLRLQLSVGALRMSECEAAGSLGLMPPWAAASEANAAVWPALLAGVSPWMRAIPFGLGSAALLLDVAAATGTGVTGAELVSLNSMASVARGVGTSGLMCVSAGGGCRTRWPSVSRSAAASAARRRTSSAYSDEKAADFFRRCAKSAAEPAVRRGRRLARLRSGGRAQGARELP